jgi:LuxR family maltose regulon positive regulatory protein
MPPDDSFLRVENLLPTAADLLERITLSAREKGRIGRVIEALVLQSLVWLAQDEVERARFALQDALSLAEPEGYVRCFIDEGPPIADLLRHISALGPEPNYAGHLLAALEGKVHVGQTVDQLALARSQLLLDPLSERELEILQLIATGMSNRDLAEELVVTVGTVKWHLNNIYSKLAVRSRTQAVAKAREIGLI